VSILLYLIEDCEAAMTAIHVSAEMLAENVAIN
jgi:hypothetical protein